MSNKNKDRGKGAKGKSNITLPKIENGNNLGDKKLFENVSDEREEELTPNVLKRNEWIKKILDLKNGEIPKNMRTFIQICVLEGKHYSIAKSELKLQEPGISKLIREANLLLKRIFEEEKIPFQFKGI